MQAPDMSTSKAMDGAEDACSICRKRYKNNHTLESHVYDCHDGQKGRKDKLRCPIEGCERDFQSRIRYEGHVGKHTVSELPPRVCPLCDQTFATAPELELHLDGHEEHQQPEDTPATPTDASAESLRELKTSLIAYTGSMYTANYFMDMACPIVLSMEDGRRITVLGVPGMVEQLTGTIARADALKLYGEADRSSIGLKQALIAHRCGGVVLDRLQSYNQLSTEACLKEYAEAPFVARLLAGGLIHSGYDVLLVLKVEVYGRSRTDDPHEQPLAFPATDDYTVQALMHGGAKKLLIGTNSWLALITSCIILSKGEVVVGPHNTSFSPRKDSIVWVNASAMHSNSLTERHLRSKFHADGTFAKNAGVFSRFGRPSCLPVTLRSLSDHFVKKRESGIKAVAEVFSRLYRERLLPAVPATLPEEGTKIRSDLQRLRMTVGDADFTAVDETISAQLRVLAESATNTIAELNRTAVTRAIEEQVDLLLSTVNV
ncbi:unnamed protein product [Mortierella alpina]